MHTNFHQWYECSSEKYYNLWQIYEQHQQHLVDGTKHIEYVIDPELIEVLKNFKKPRNTFSIKKIIKQEYSSTFSTIIAFLYLDFLINITYAMQNVGSVHMYNNIYLYVFILAIIGYVTMCLKVFRKHTSLLDD